MSPDQLWNAALGELEIELSKAKFTTWLQDTFILQQEEGSIIVGVPNAFTKSWLENKYHPAIIKALRRISDEDVRMVSYQVTSKQKNRVVVGANAAIEEEEQQPTIIKAAVRSSAATPSKNNTVTVTIPAEQSVSSDDLGLNPRYTFENFIVGKENELAHAACLAVSERPGSAYNPLFIYGGVGLGKTHLMQAVGHAVLKRTPSKKILYVTCEVFTNEFIRAVGEGRAEQFKDKYRSVDILMIDDIQFLAGKEGTQEQFFHTFNHLHQRNKQVIMTSDRHPRAIPTLENRLVSRLEGGMIVDVSIPNLETRIAILRLKCEEKNYALPQDIAQYIASNVQNNIRELEGVLNRVIAYHQLNKQTPTVDSVKSVLASFSQIPKRGTVTTKKILTIVSHFFDVDQKDIIGDSRKKELVVPRQIAMYLMREETHASYPNIGQELGGRDHTTAMHACTKIAKLKEDDERTENDINMIRERLYNS